MKETEITFRRQESELRLGSELDLRRLSRLCGQVNAFGTNANDEFMVHREDGRTQGIFKTWAVPVIPFIDQGRLDVLESVWDGICTQARSGKTFEEALDLLGESPNTAESAHTAKQLLQDWHERCFSEPARLKESLEKARVTSWVLDRRLTQLFNQDELSSDTAERIGQLTDRLVVSFGLLSPFYNLEALVGDPKGFQWNPVRQAEVNLDESVMVPGGKLDLVAQLLPSALSSFVEAEKLDWHCLTWDKIRQTSSEILGREGNSRKALLNAAEAAQTSPENILFAANVLEWIPVRVGGKKGDLTQEAAGEQIANIKVDGSRGGTAKVVQIGKDINGLIRFMNWLPLVRGEDNFQFGTNWTYASVCDTATELLSTISTHPEVWQGSFGEIFSSHLLPQLKNLDARLQPRGGFCCT